MQAFRLSDPEFTGGASPYEGFALNAPKTAYTGDAAMSYHFAETGTKLRAHVGNAFKAPSLFQRFGSSFFFGSFSPFGDPRLSPERTVSFDAGVDMFTLNVLQRFGKRVDVAFDLFAASEFPTPFFTSAGTRAFVFDGPLKADVTASYKWPLSDRKSLKLFGKIENVLDRQYFEGGFRSPGIWGTVGLAFGF